MHEGVTEDRGDEVVCVGGGFGGRGEEVRRPGDNGAHSS